MKKILVCLAVLALSGCSSSPTKPTSSAATAKTPVGAEFTPTPLTKDEAFTRSKQVGHPAYELWFGLNTDPEDYEGRVVVGFDLKPKATDHGSNLFIDFQNGSLHSIILNGTTLQDVATADRYDGNRIHFKLNELRKGPNRIEIAFTHPYSHNGHGLHRFQDPVDKAIYLYSDLEPFFAHNIFPCFDQPDLKATFELTVETPPQWQVITNTLERDVSNVDGRKSWAFPASPLLSTYVFALIAGDYTSWKADAEGIPLRLFSRKSLKKYVDFKEWFDITRKGLDFYATQFGYPYPYSKYDQIIVPEFDEGAMENAGAITFTERTVYRTKVTRQKREQRADTILHEMAHMWFGDLVTMKWWNGLWLNESFATFMSHWAMSETLPVVGMTKNTAWEDFFAGDKQWAYWQDQLVTTHPIELPVPDTDHAFSNFDGITYGKGASVIKQLRYYLGDEDFREGIQRYFQKYAFHNTTLAEFMKMLAEASGKDLTSWQDAWLMTAGVNSLKVDWACATDPNDAQGVSKISKLDLLQSPAENSTVLRPHRTEIGLYTLGAKGKLQLKEAIPATYSAAQTSVAEAIGKPCPELIYPNTNDYDYVRVELDPQSLKKVSSQLSSIDDTLTRQMMWFSLWEMVVNGKISPASYADVVLKQITSEKDNQVLEKTLRSLVNLGLNRDSALEFMTLEQRGQYLPQVEELATRELKSSAPGSDPQLIWFHTLLSAASTPTTLAYLREVLNGTQHISGLKIDQEVRWSIVETLARNGAADSNELIQKELMADPTDMGKKSSIAALVQIPDKKNKSDWADKIFAAAPKGATGELSAADLEEVMSNFNVLGQDALIQDFVGPYFDHLPQAVKSTDEVFTDLYTSSLFPQTCTQDVVDRTAKALKSSDLPASARKNLMTRKQEEERCMRARANTAGI
jgi:aminopeptidase N